MHVLYFEWVIPNKSANITHVSCSAFPWISKRVTISFKRCYLKYVMTILFWYLMLWSQHKKVPVRAGHSSYIGYCLLSATYTPLCCFCTLTVWICQHLTPSYSHVQIKTSAPGESFWNSLNASMCVGEGTMIAHLWQWKHSRHNYGRREGIQRMHFCIIYLVLPNLS